MSNRIPEYTQSYPIWSEPFNVYSFFAFRWFVLRGFANSLGRPENKNTSLGSINGQGYKNCSETAIGLQAISHSAPITVFLQATSHAAPITVFLQAIPHAAPITVFLHRKENP
jgi:hypothetical protein